MSFVLPRVCPPPLSCMRMLTQPGSTQSVHLSEFMERAMAAAMSAMLPLLLTMARRRIGSSELGAADVRVRHR